MAKNGNGKELIKYKVDNLCLSMEKVHEKLDKLGLDVNGIGTRVNSTQCELTEYKEKNPVEKELTEHKQNHYFWVGLLFGSGVLFIVAALIIK